MLRITVLTLLFVFTGCGMQLIPKQDFVLVEGVSTKLHKKTDEQFVPLVNHFEQYARTEYNDPSFKVGDIPVNFGNPKNSSHDGVCLIYADGSREILIRKNWWDSANLMRRKIMIFHELGHCRLDRRHNDETVQVNGITYKVSIMHPVIPDSYEYGMHKDGYLKELFTKSKTSLLNLLGAN